MASVFSLDFGKEPIGSGAKILIVLLVLYLFFSFTDTGRAITAFVQANFNAIFLLVMMCIIAYLILKNRVKPHRRPAKDCLRNAIRNGHMKIPRGFRTWQDMWNTIRNDSIQWLERHGGWAMTGEVSEVGKQDTVIIAAMDDKGEIINGMGYPLPYGNATVQKLEKKRLPVEESALTQARAHLEYEKIAKQAKSTAEEEATT